MCGLTAQPGAHVVPKAHDQALSMLSLKLCRYHAIVPRLKCLATIVHILA